MTKYTTLHDKKSQGIKKSMYSNRSWNSWEYTEWPDKPLCTIKIYHIKTIGNGMCRGIISQFQFLHSVILKYESDEQNCIKTIAILAIGIVTVYKN